MIMGFRLVCQGFSKRRISLTEFHTHSPSDLSGFGLRLGVASVQADSTRQGTYRWSGVPMGSLCVVLVKRFALMP
jgi:hypothetical protein